MGWHGLRVYGLRIELPLPPHNTFPGHHARGLLGRALFDTVCLYSGQKDDRFCVDCALKARCAYPAVFKPVESERLAPYWLHRWEQRGATLRCTLHVLESVRPFLEAWLTGLQRYGNLLDIRDAATDTPLADRGRLNLEGLHPLPAPVLPGDACRLQALTPIVSKHRGEAFYGALRTRAQRLIQSYGDGVRLAVEENPWVTTVEADYPVEIPLHRRILRGRLYRLRLDRITEPGRELLAWGQWLHAGGHTSVGCGAYLLEPVATPRNPAPAEVEARG